MAGTRTTPAEFVRQVRREVNRVTWPTRKETMISVVMVMVMVVVCAVFFLIIDNLIAMAIEWILGLGR